MRINISYFVNNEDYSKVIAEDQQERFMRGLPEQPSQEEIQVVILRLVREYGKVSWNNSNVIQDGRPTEEE